MGLWANRHLMQTVDPDIDAGRSADWGRTSADYAAHRPGPPAQFYDMLAVLGLGVAGQRVADLATGTGLLAQIAPARFCVPHRVEASIFEVVPS